MEKIIEPEIIELPNVNIGILSLKEISKEVMHSFLFSELEKEEFCKIKFEKRKKEFVAVRLILESLLGEKNEIIYNENGKPQLKNKSHFISISHSSDFAVVLLSKENAGIDAENVNRSTKYVASRFLSETEINCINNSQNPQLLSLLYWCAKEAAFKFSVLPELEFKSQITVQPFRIIESGGNFKGCLSKNFIETPLLFNYFFYENNIIVYCVEIK